jgi:hypothetical protein
VSYSTLLKHNQAARAYTLHNGVAIGISCRSRAANMLCMCRFTKWFVTF